MRTTTAKKRISDYPFTGNLMAGLIYPSVLGSGIVWLMQYAGNHFSGKDASWAVMGNLFSDTHFLFGLWFLVYFSLSWMTMVNENDYKYSYGFFAFVIDLAEAINIFLAFLWLGLVDKGFNNMHTLYVSFLAIPALAILSSIILRGSFSRKNMGLVTLIALAFSIFMLICWEKLKNPDIIGLVGFTFLLTWYFIPYLKQELSQEKAK